MTKAEPRQDRAFHGEFKHSYSQPTKAQGDNEADQGSQESRIDLEINANADEEHQPRHKAHTDLRTPHEVP